MITHRFPSAVPGESPQTLRATIKAVEEPPRGPQYVLDGQRSAYVLDVVIADVEAVNLILALLPRLSCEERADVAIKMLAENAVGR